MKKLMIIFIIILLCGCQVNVAKTIPGEKPILDMELGIKRAAVFLLIMRGERWGEEELTVEIEYLKYLISQK